MACRLVQSTHPRSLLAAGQRSRLPAASPALVASQWNRQPASRRCRRRAAPLLPAAAASGSGTNGASSREASSGSSADGAEPSSNGSSGSVSMRPLEPSSSTAEGSSTAKGSSSGRPPKPPPRPRPSGRFAWLAEALQGLRGPATLRRIITVLFMFGLGSALSLASSRGRCAGPQEVSCGRGCEKKGPELGLRSDAGRHRGKVLAWYCLWSYCTGLQDAPAAAHALYYLHM